MVEGSAWLRPRATAYSARWLLSRVQRGQRARASDAALPRGRGIKPCTWTRSSGRPGCRPPACGWGQIGTEQSKGEGALDPSAHGVLAVLAQMSWTPRPPSGKGGLTATAATITAKATATRTSCLPASLPLSLHHQHRGASGTPGEPHPKCLGLSMAPLQRENHLEDHGHVSARQTRPQP